MNGITELAKLFKQRENPNLLGVCLGTVVNLPPDLSIKLNEKITLTPKNLILSETLSLKELTSGDKVIIIPSTNEQLFFVLDKAVV